MTLKVGISGLRGTVSSQGEDLTATTVVEWVQAFVARLQDEHGTSRPFIALGHDARRSSPAFYSLARGALLTAGADVLELGLTLTPSVQFAVRHDERLHGGLMITASHNPVIWNGLKFLNGEGLFLPITWWEAMASDIEAGALPATALDKIGRVEDACAVAWEAHQQAVLAALPVETIRSKRYRVALDACNGGAARWAETLSALGCETILLHSEQDGYFAREAEPLPAHLAALRDLVRTAHCDLGLAADPDGDRLVLVDAQGDSVSEEHTVVLAAMALAREQGDRIAVNLVTTHALEDALPHTVVVRTAVGEMNVVQGVLANDALLGGEGSGGIIVPAVNLARDGLAAAGLILSLLAERDVPLHRLVAGIPHWTGIKAKLSATEGSPEALRTLFAMWNESAPTVTVTVGGVELASEVGLLTLGVKADGSDLQLMATLPNGEVVRASGEARNAHVLFDMLGREGAAVALDLTDGVKLLSDRAWVSLRPSNTEPVVRVMGEIREGE